MSNEPTTHGDVETEELPLFAPRQDDVEPTDQTEPPMPKAVQEKLEALERRNAELAGALSSLQAGMQRPEPPASEGDKPVEVNLGPLLTDEFEYQSDGDKAFASDIKSLHAVVKGMKDAIAELQGQVREAVEGVGSQAEVHRASQLRSLESSIKSAVESEKAAGRDLQEAEIKAAMGMFGAALARESNGVIGDDFVMRSVLAYRAAKGITPEVKPAPNLPTPARNRPGGGTRAMTETERVLQDLLS